MRPSALFLSGALGLILFAWALTRLSAQFGYDWAVFEMPISSLAALLVSAGIIFFGGVMYAKRSAPPTPLNNSTVALAIIIVAGLLARMVLFSSEPALEDDYQRYFWDGAVTAHGHNPYKFAPQTVLNGAAGAQLEDIAKQSGPVLDRINHKNLTTIYPPLAQAAFAIAHVLEPFSLTSWRSVLLVSDVATLGLVLALLSLLNRSLLWSAVYWWNPVVLKEFFNSAHMDALVLPFVLGALYLALKARPMLATVALACAVGTKVWPVLLAPLVWRQTLKRPAQALSCVLVFLAICAVWLMPYLAAGWSENSGTLTYAERWTINSPLFTSVRSTVRWALLSFMDPAGAAKWGSILSRALMAGLAGLIALAVARHPIKNPTDFLHRALVTIAAVIFLSPAIYPWYTLWMAPLLALLPYTGLLLLFATIPLYYTYFYFAAREMTNLYQNGMVWIVWLPVWLTCVYCWWHSTNATGDHDNAHETRHMTL